MIAEQSNEARTVAQDAATLRRRPAAALAVELTYSCNQACAYCYNPDRGRPVADERALHRGTISDGSASGESGPVGAAEQRGIEATTDLVLSRVRRLLSAWDLSIVTLTGGEPLAHPALFPLLELLQTNRIRRQLISNGTLVTPEVAQQLAKYSVEGVQITLNGPNAAQHRAHVGRDSFDQAIRGARELIGAGVKVIGCIVVTRQNAEHVGAIIELWREIGAERIALSRFSPAGMSLNRLKSWLPRRQDLMTAFDQAMPYATSGMPIHCTVPVPACLLDTSQFASISFGQCAIGSPYQEFALGPDGALRLCTLHDGRLDAGRDVLDLDWDLATVAMSKEVRTYRARIPQFCVDCAAAVSCLGGCSASVPYRADGAPRALDPLVLQYFPNQDVPTMLRRSLDGECLGVEP